MNQRPTSITVISWILIVIGVISLISTTAMLNNATVLELMAKSPLPIPVQHAISYIGLLITIVCGLAMLKPLGLLLRLERDACVDVVRRECERG